MQDSEKVVIVTGAAQGIGRGIAKHFLDSGMQVVLADIHSAALSKTAESLGKQNRLLAFTTDVSDEHSVKALIAAVQERFGRIDALINNAGIANPLSGPVEKLPLAEWNRIIGTNLTGCFLCAKHAVPLLRRQRGSIVNIASTRAIQSEPDTEAYAASKGGIVALTHALAISLGPHIRVNCVSPGWIVNDPPDSHVTAPQLRPIDHSQHPCGRVGCPNDIASMAAYLISENAGFITGQHFIVDGGMTKKMIYAE